MKKMLAYQNDPQLKKMLVDEVIRHRKADQIIQRTYGREEDGQWKGCAVGCAVHSLNLKLGKDYHTDNHSVYETELGIPETLAYLEDAIFEGLPKEKAKVWPERFLKSVSTGADLSLVTPKFMVWLMNDLQHHAKETPSVLACLETVANLYQRLIDGGTVTDQEWNEAAWSAAWTAETAGPAWSAVRAAAWSASWAARAAWWAAWWAAGAAWSARRATAEAARAAVRAEPKYELMANKLIDILENTK